MFLSSTVTAPIAWSGANPQVRRLSVLRDSLGHMVGVYVVDNSRLKHLFERVSTLWIVLEHNRTHVRSNVRPAEARRPIPPRAAKGSPPAHLFGCARSWLGFIEEALMSTVAVWGRPWAGARPLPSVRPVVSVIEGYPGLELPSPARLRLTRAGRLAVTLLCFAVLSFTVLTIWGMTSSAPPSRVATVRAGQSLSDIALSELPQLPAMEAVARIRIANQLNSTRLEPGQRLVIPGVG